MDVLADNCLTITTVIADGMPTMDYADIKNSILQNIYLFFLAVFSYWLIGKAGPIRKKIVCKMMGRTPESFDRIVYKNASWQSWVNQDRCMIGWHRDFILFERTDMYIWHGVASATEKKLTKYINEWKEKGYDFTYKEFNNMGMVHLLGNIRNNFTGGARSTQYELAKEGKVLIIPVFGADFLVVIESMIFSGVRYYK